MFAKPVVQETKHSIVVEKRSRRSGRNFEHLVLLFNLEAGANGRYVEAHLFESGSSTGVPGLGESITLPSLTNSYHSVVSYIAMTVVMSLILQAHQTARQQYLAHSGTRHCRCRYYYPFFVETAFYAAKYTRNSVQPCNRSSIPRATQG